MAEKSLLSREERKAKREERRARQRAANIGRAAEMHEARRAWEAEAQPAAAPAALGPVHVGCSGW
jgi:hypothetical protein